MRPTERHESNIPLYVNQLQWTQAHSLIVEAWSRNCGYTEYITWCKRFGQEPLDEQLFDVFYEALAEQYFFETAHPQH